MRCRSGWRMPRGRLPSFCGLRYRQGITLIAYIDDILIIGESESSTRRDTDAAYECLMSLGFRINQEKSERDPSTIRTFLGTVKMTFSLHPEKWRKLRNTLVQMHRLDMATPRQMAALIGKLNWTLHMSLPARLKIRPLLRWKHRALTTTSGHWDTPVELDSDGLETLDWWIQFFPQWNGKSFRPRVSEATIFTDASDYGWGAVLSIPGQPQEETRGHWPDYWKGEHINLKELMALGLALKTFGPRLQGITTGPIGNSNTAPRVRRMVSIMWMIDNTTAMSHVAKFGGRAYRLSRLAEEILEWALRRGWEIRPEYIPSEENVQADALSRAPRDRSDWTLNALVFQSAMHRLRYRPDVDLFATWQNAQLETTAGRDRARCVVSENGLSRESTVCQPALESNRCGTPAGAVAAGSDNGNRGSFLGTHESAVVADVEADAHSTAVVVADPTGPIPGRPPTGRTANAESPLEGGDFPHLRRWYAVCGIPPSITDRLLVTRRKNESLARRFDR